MYNRHIAFSTVFVFILLGICSNAFSVESHAGYTSIHKKPITLSYTDSAGEQKSKTVSGFLDIYDITDPVVKTTIEQTGNNANATDNWWMPSVIWKNMPLAANSRIRVFIPPGTLRMILYMYCAQKSEVKTVVRFKTVPGCLNATCTAYQTSFTPEGSFWFEKYQNEDVHLENAGGHIDVYNQYLNPAKDWLSDPLPSTEGGWLYIYTYNAPEGVTEIQFALNIDETSYTNWFTNYKAAVTSDPQNDTFGLLLNSTTSPVIDPGPVTPGPSTGDELSVNLGVSPSSGPSPLKVTFTPTILNGTADIYNWTFGDGNKSSEVPSLATGTVTHTYNADGIYPVTLEVENSTEKKTASTTVPITVAPTKTYEQGYAAGKKSCIDDPKSCGISAFTIQNNYDINLEYAEIPNILERHDIELKSLIPTTGEVKWKLGTVAPSSPVTPTTTQ